MANGVRGGSIEAPRIFVAFVERLSPSSTRWGVKTVEGLILQSK